MIAESLVVILAVAILALRVVVGLVGVGYGVFGWRHAHGDYQRALANRDNGSLVIMAEWAYRTEQLRLVKQVAIVSVAIWTAVDMERLMFNIETRVPLDLYFLSSGVWLLVSGSITWLSVLEWRDRRRMDALSRRS